jgi:hypothetical protein
LSKARLRLRLRDSKGCCFIPSRSESFRGDAAKLFIFLSEEESSIPWRPFLLWREQENLERVQAGQCRSGGIQNNEILPENEHFHKVIVMAESADSPFVFKCLRPL